VIKALIVSTYIAFALYRVALILFSSRLTSTDTHAYFVRSKCSLRVGQRAYFGRSKMTLLNSFISILIGTDDWQEY